jgi:FAD/FMN-containing dehydrogenase
MTGHQVLTAGQLEQLRDAVRGAVIAPDHHEYDQARAVWNGHIDRRPAAVVRCSGVADVMVAVRCAAEWDLPLAVRGGGHSFGGFGTCDGGIVVDLAAMNGVRVNPQERRAMVQGGATWGDFDHEAAAFHLATTGGLISTTGVGGLTLGGGIGWLMRKHGMACDNVTAADVVTAPGELVHTSAEEHSELFWALRGGGGNFGVVTAFDFELHPVSQVVGGALLFPGDRAGDVLAAYAEAARDEPDELCSLLEVATAPDIEDVHPAHRGRPVIAFCFCHSGSRGDGRAVADRWRQVAPVVADFVDEMPYPILQTIFDSDYPHGTWAYMRSHYLTDLTAPAIAALVEAAGDRPLGRSIIDIHHLGGAAARVPAAATAFDHREAGFAVLFGAVSGGANGFDDQTAWGRCHWEALAPHATGGAYGNFVADRDQAAVHAAWSDTTLGRLAAVKRQYDPQNLFRLNHNVEPSNVTASLAHEMPNAMITAQRG